MKEGDIFFIKEGEAKFEVFKVLKVDNFPQVAGGWLTYHLRVYHSVRSKPIPETISTLQMRCGSAPLDGKHVEEHGEVICNQPVTREELDPFWLHLKLTNFSRYLEETHQTIDQVCAEANRFYEDGSRLADEKRYAEAIEAYSQAAELLPSYWEAIDNCGLCRMDLGDFRGAIADFEAAIEARKKDPTEAPDPTALFSMGECHFKLGELDNARSIFKQCLDQWPNDSNIREALQCMPELKMGLAPQRPWWKLW